MAVNRLRLRRWKYLLIFFQEILILRENCRRMWAAKYLQSCVPISATTIEKDFILLIEITPPPPPLFYDLNAHISFSLPSCIAICQIRPQWVCLISRQSGATHLHIKVYMKCGQFLITSHIKALGM